MDNGPDVQDALLDSSGQRTVPNVSNPNPTRTLGHRPEPEPEPEA